MKFFNNSVIQTAVYLSITLNYSWADQPPLSVPVVNAPCQDGPKMVGGQPDTVVSTPDAEGFFSLFNGTDLTGWWENCQTHTTDTKLGGVWIVDPSQKAIYSREEGANGNILVTNKKFDHYELIMDVWPIFGNDGGVFNRVTNSGSCWQSTIDYIQGSSVGGSFNEKGWTPGNLNDDPFLFGGNPRNPSISTWTNFTKDLNPTSFGCSSTGCVAADFEKIWDVNGWNQLRIKFYDGLTVGRSVTMENFIRKLGAEAWVPTYKKTVAQVTPAGPIGLQIHGQGRWKDGTYNMYRNIKIRPLKIDGTPVFVPVNVERNETRRNQTQMILRSGVITGLADSDYDLLISDVNGNVIESIRGFSGSFSHALPAHLRGILIGTLRTSQGTSVYRFHRL
jgi:hypothetical protein